MVTVSPLSAPLIISASLPVLKILPLDLMLTLVNVTLTQNVLQVCVPLMSVFLLVHSMLLLEILLLAAIVNQTLIVTLIYVQTINAHSLNHV